MLTHQLRHIDGNSNENRLIVMMMMMIVMQIFLLHYCRDNRFTKQELKRKGLAVFLQVWNNSFLIMLQTRH